MLKIPEKIKYVLDVLAQNGYEAYIVGGCVRDALLGLEPSDYDITTSARPEEIMEIFEKTIPTGIKHGTVTVMAESEPVEVTTFRTEGRYLDSRHPENVEFVTDLREDLSRRDFTVNAMAYNAEKGLIDIFGGATDLKNKLLRAVGEPRKRFSEDALRILRLFRFSSQLGFDIEENTLNSALKLQKGLENISRERIFAELIKLLNGKNQRAILPLIASRGLEFLGLEKIPCFTEIPNEDLRLFVFLSSSSKNPTEALKGLKASNRQIDITEKLLILEKLEAHTKEDIKNALFLTDLEAVSLHFELKNRNKLFLEEIIEKREPYLISHLDIGGEDLIALGYSGREIGERLELLRQEVIKDKNKNKREILISLTK